MPDKVQPQKEAPEGQLKSLVVAGSMEYLYGVSLLTSSPIAEEQVFWFWFLFLVHNSKKQIFDGLGREIVDVIFATWEENM